MEADVVCIQFYTTWHNIISDRFFLFTFFANNKIQFNNHNNHIMYNICHNDTSGLSLLFPSICFIQVKVGDKG